MGLESEVVEAFLDELRKDARLKESVIAKLQALLNRKSVTQESLLELIETNANSKDKKH